LNELPSSDLKYQELFVTRLIDILKHVYKFDVLTFSNDASLLEVYEEEYVVYYHTCRPSLFKLIWNVITFCMSVCCTV